MPHDAGRTPEPPEDVPSQEGWPNDGPTGPRRGGSELPTPLRAALGLVADTVDRLRAFPAHAPDLPVQVISSAMQASLKAQQRYAELTTRGDELLAALRGQPDEPPSWATFDDEVDAQEAADTARRMGTEAEPADLETAQVDPDAPVRTSTLGRTRSAFELADLEPAEPDPDAPVGSAPDQPDTARTDLPAPPPAAGASRSRVSRSGPGKSTARTTSARKATGSASAPRSRPKPRD